MIKTKTQPIDFIFSQFGWKSYNLIKKKAMEQEFSWSGLILSLSIAFFIVIVCAESLSLIYQSLETKKKTPAIFGPKIYRLENSQQINLEANYQLYKNLLETQAINVLV